MRGCWRHTDRRRELSTTSFRGILGTFVDMVGAINVELLLSWFCTAVAGVFLDIALVESSTFVHVYRIGHASKKLFSMLLSKAGHYFSLVLHSR